jgi:hypothetical protein
MSEQKQKTIKSEIIIKGIGLHTGRKCQAIFKPAPENAGIQFVRGEGTSVDFYVDNVLKQNATDSKTTNVNAVVNFNGEVGRTGTANMYLDEIFFTTSAISTSTRDALWNSGNGAEICVTAGCGAVASGPIRRIIGTGIFR